MTEHGLKHLLKWLWIAAVLIAVSIYVVEKRQQIWQMLVMFPASSVMSATLLVFFAKLCLVANMRSAALHFDIVFTWRDSYCVYNLTQLAKYIPGSIWQFVGRVGILRERGVSMSRIRDSLLAEHAWVVFSALPLSFVALMLSKPDFIFGYLTNYGIELETLWIILLVILLTTIAFTLFFTMSRVVGWLSRFVPRIETVPLMIFTWFFLGSSLWVTLEVFSNETPSLIYVVGIFGFAYVLGFVVPFAPAGLGIREAVLVFALLPYMGADEAILVTAVNRLVYFLVELAVVLPCLRKFARIGV